MQQFGVEQYRPSAGLDDLACVGLTAYLPGGYAHECVLRHVVLDGAVGQFGQHTVVEEHAIDVITVQTVPERGQLVVMDDADERMLHRSADIPRVVIHIPYA